MSRIIWDAVGTRFYETGVDSGVLYLGTTPGVAWSGLISVGETPSGGEPKPYYLDGFKYINVASAEEFEATLEAFSSPVEFSECDGSIQLCPGLFVDQQPRKPFGLVYRSLIGNDVNGKDHGYKLHLIYNALAAPSSQNNNTINNSSEPVKLSWAITTNPPAFSGYRPSSHLTIDSRKTPKNLLTAIKDILYGLDFIDPRLPSPQEVKDLFVSPGPTIRRNLVADPRGTLAAYWAPNFGTNGVGTETMVSGAVDGPLMPDGVMNTNYARYTITSPNTVGNSYYYGGTSAATFNDVPAGKFMHGVYIRSSIATTIRSISFLYKDVVAVTSTGSTVDIAILANTWVYVGSVRTAASPFNAVRTGSYIIGLTVAGQTIDVSCAIVEPNVDNVTPYFDGLTIDADGISYDWESTPNFSSIARSWGPI